jgi:hypothetical protein
LSETNTGCEKNKHECQDRHGNRMATTHRYPPRRTGRNWKISYSGSSFFDNKACVPASMDCVTSTQSLQLQITSACPIFSGTRNPPRKLLNNQLA